MHDILPDETRRWRSLENSVTDILGRYGYNEIRLPTVEKTELFSHSLGESTDIVTKEMYTFVDQGEDSLTLRPEGTAGCVRSMIQHSMLNQVNLRLWYAGAMFRREQPQKGRTRQFHQIGAEAFGFPGPDIDAELIIMTARIWQALAIEGLELQVNTIGTRQSRHAYRSALVDYFNTHAADLDTDSRARLDKNPLRILDSKNPEMQELIRNAPDIHDFLDDESWQHYSGVKAILDHAGIAYVENQRLVRGLDYYNKTVFEWITDRLGAQGAVCAGGRYDGLFEVFGGKAIPAAGFAMGLDRLVAIMGRNVEHDEGQADIYLIVAGDRAAVAGAALAEEIRDAIPLRVVMHCGGGSFKSQFKKADRSGAKIAVILGDAELEQGLVGLKPLRSDVPQTGLPRDQLVGTLKRELGM